MPNESSLVPFWFWNDVLDAREIERQIDDFAAHGVHGFVIHPRVGLPRECGWMSESLLGFMDIAIESAARRGMRVLLYDEGMYPSGSSCGQVVASDPSLACRCLAPIEFTGELQLPEGANLVATHARSDGTRIAIVDRKVNAYIRGLHYIGDGPKEDEPPAGDILNPRTAEKIIDLIYRPFVTRFQRCIGNTVVGIFTDEPGPLGKCREKIARPGTTGIVPHLSEIVGYDLTPKLAGLWYADEPDAEQTKRDYARAIRKRLEETWYRPLSEFCAAHGVSLCGHPDRGDEIGAQRYFHIPGQDVVWRFIEPGKPSAIEGHESTQAKCTASAMIHRGRRFNSNEFCGAYGHETAWDEVQWLANWLLIRGVNLLIPHAFYYSIRGPRKDERPPQLGPHTPQWDDGTFARFAAHCATLCDINTDSTPICNVAILTDDECPWRAAKWLLQNQIDFHYLEADLLEEGTARADAWGVAIKPMRYATIIVEPTTHLPDAVRGKLDVLRQAGRVIEYTDDASLEPLLSQSEIVRPQLSAPAPGLRYRHVVKSGVQYIVFFNEDATPIDVDVRLPVAGTAAWIDTATGAESPATPIRDATHRLTLDRFELKVMKLR
jgi:hypothetical protein